MSLARNLPQRILVIGDGQVGILAAIALRRALPSTDIAVMHMGSDMPAPTIADSMSVALPFANNLHAKLGISEADLIRHAHASHRLIVRYTGFADEQPRAATYFGDANMALLPRCDSDGMYISYAPAFLPTLNEQLANEGRFALSKEGLADVAYGLRWNVDTYRAYLIRYAQHLGIGHIEGRIEAISDNQAGGIASLQIAQAGDVSADLIIDTHGICADHLAAKDQDKSGGWIDWSPMLPTRQLYYAALDSTISGTPILALEDRVTLFSKGWLAQVAGRDGLGRMFGAFEGVRAEEVQSILGAEPLYSTALSPRCRTQAWAGNVIAIGDAYAQFEPLGWLNLDLAHRQLDLLLQILPGANSGAEERNAYNRRATLMADGARDAVAAHFMGIAAKALCPDVTASAELDILIDQFQRRRRIAFFEESPFGTNEWLSLLDAIGIYSKHSALEKAADGALMQQRQNDHLNHIDRIAKVVPRYEDWLRAI